MGILFSGFFSFVATQKAQTRGKRCVAILKQTELHLHEMQTKYRMSLKEVDDAIQVGAAMPQSSPYETQQRKDRLVELLRKRKTLRHFLGVAQRRNQQVLAKTLAVEALEVNQMQVDALRSTAAAFEVFSRKNGVENLERASDTLSEHMDALADIDDIMAESGRLPLGFNDDDQDDLIEELEAYGIQDAPTHTQQKLGFETIRVPTEALPKIPEEVEEAGVGNVVDPVEIVLAKPPVLLGV
jgi:hypothetical protein